MRENGKFHSDTFVSGTCAHSGVNDIIFWHFLFASTLIGSARETGGSDTAHRASHPSSLLLLFIPVINISKSLCLKHLNYLEQYKREENERIVKSAMCSWYYCVGAEIIGWLINGQKKVWIYFVNRFI